MKIAMAILLLAAADGGTKRAGAEDFRIESMGVTVIDQVNVPAQETGALAELRIRVGQRVKAGEVLARVHAADVALEVTRAEIAVATAREQATNDVRLRLAREALKLAELDLRRAEESVKQYAKSVTQAQIDRLTIAVAQAQLGIEQAEKELAIARLTLAASENELAVARRRLERHQIVAPLDGVVVELPRRAGEWVQPGEPVARIVRVDSLRAEGFVRADDLPPDLLGRAAAFRVEAPGAGPIEAPAVITFVSPEVNAVTGQVRVWAEFENRRQQIRPGSTGTLTVTK